ncbi:GNAT family N-acetyltransferase [Halegenticoccus tardaugens]|uniref:GNAT family N-acetyltransferase n=1 Tax=Halegenticoccus tardaugens TaxID=2071624 RepID=UPI00100B2135|nr:GNAT family N-acetyltransferase [Halegenticoccus tardaugens]
MQLDAVTDLSDGQIEDYCSLYQSYLWWQDRTLEDVRTAIANTDVVVGLADEDSGELVAAGRAFTDSVYYGKIYDVIVEESLRGRGIGRDLMRELVRHPALESLDVLTLDCREGLIPFYERCGFRRHELTARLEDREEDLVPMKYDYGSGGA